MGKNLKNLVPAIFSSSKNRAETGQLWQWASCNHPKTLSFRAGDVNGMFKTVNSVFFDPAMDGFGLDHSPEASWFTSTSESASHSTESDDQLVVDESLEVLVRRTRSSDRLFFEPRGDSSSILGQPGSAGVESVDPFPPFKESVALAMESEDPYMDFRRSMEEMVESCSGIKSWECLEELLAWYLRMNGKNNHGFIVEAFIDLLLNLSLNESNDKDCQQYSNKNVVEVTSFSSAASSFSDDSDPSLKGEDV